MIQLSIATPDRMVFDDQVFSVSVPGSLGYMQILPNHAAIITSLGSGKVTFLTHEHKEISYMISGGLFEFSANHASLLADTIE